MRGGSQFFSQTVVLKSRAGRHLSIKQKVSSSRVCDQFWTHHGGWFGCSGGEPPQSFLAQIRRRAGYIRDSPRIRSREQGRRPEGGPGPCRGTASRGFWRRQGSAPAFAEAPPSGGRGSRDLPRSQGDGPIDFPVREVSQQTAGRRRCGWAHERGRPPNDLALAESNSHLREGHGVCIFGLTRVLGGGGIFVGPRSAVIGGRGTSRFARKNIPEMDLRRRALGGETRSHGPAPGQGRQDAGRWMPSGGRAGDAPVGDPRLGRRDIAELLRALGGSRLTMRTT